MTIRNLQYLLNPRSIAVIGQGANDDALDAVVQQNLINSSFDGPVMPVNPGRRAVSGVLSYEDVAQLPEVPDLAILTGPLGLCPQLISELGARGTRAVSILTHERLDSYANQGADLRQALLDAAKPNLLRILGPDSLGFAVPETGVNATVDPIDPPAGNIAVLTQSAAVMRAILNWARPRKVGFSHLISLGRRLDVDEDDLLDYLAQDYRTRSIVMHLERIGNPRKFMSAARTAARLKPVIVLRPRNYADPVDDAIHDAAFRRAGVVCVDTAEQLITAVETLVAVGRKVRDDRLVIIGNSRSLGLLGVDALLRQGGSLAVLGEEKQSELENSVASITATDNPVDLGEHPDADAYAAALRVLLQGTEADGVLIVHVPRLGAQDSEIARVIAEQAAKSRRLIMTNWLGLPDDSPIRQQFREAGVATYRTPDEAGRAFADVAQYFRNQALLLNAPPSIPEEFTPDVTAAQRIIEAALQSGKDRLHPDEANELLAAYEIPVVTTHYAANPREAAELAAELNGSAALKVLSPDIANRADVGGVALDLNTPADVLTAASALTERVKDLIPGAVIDGYAVQPMLARQGAYELTIGMRTGRHFGGGPVLRFGQGGTEADVIDDLAYGIPPLNMQLACEMMSRTRIFSTLRTSPARPAHLDAIALTLIKVSQLIMDVAEITSLDINPLWADAAGVRVLNARIWIAEASGPARERLAIRPYPKELEQARPLPDGRTFLLRPILPEDATPLQAMVKRMSVEDRRLRFFQPIKELAPELSARLTQLDYDREMAFVVAGPGVPGKADLWGVVRMHADPDLESAEYAVAVDRSMGGMGLGTALMRLIIDYARQRGIRKLYGEVLRENTRMLKLNEALGFTIQRDPDDAALMLVSLDLSHPSP